MQQFKPLRRDLYVRLCQPRNVAARPAKARDETELDRVGARFKYDWNSRGCRLCRKRRRGAGRSNHRYLATHQIGRHRRQPVVLPLRPAVLDRNIAVIDVTGLAQTFQKGR